MTSYPSAPPPGQPGGSDGGSSPFGTPPPAAGQGWAGGSPFGNAGTPVPPQQGAPVCPRHPDRVSYVSCQRCGRPTCPECQRPAAVGVHCVDCVREATKNVRPRTTVFGAKVQPGARPVVTITMIALCVLVFLIDMVDSSLRQAFTFSPASGRIEPWRMLTTAFLHAPGSFGIVHLGFNMVALWFTGPFLEQALGRIRFLALYLVSALGGSVAVLLLTPLELWERGAVGASGAVFGLFGAVAVVMLRLKMRNSSIFSVIGMNLVITFLVPNISWQAHLGGLLTGAAIAAVYAYLPKKLQQTGAIAGVSAIAVALILAAVIRYGMV
ncbi:rhomboid family intramembrane serine protease [Pseudactinotalea terrae]|uniref:rhomboid family intramembrane serine protease n=1 Tax=Pseudactinotalea terrae TaxID=1743262 RepID=UPI0012E1AC67|nr:rhomboid family intramembrane serine protease [Pseudactinotalea terrae]